MRVQRWDVGVVDIVYDTISDVADRAKMAQADGFAHIDARIEMASDLALPIGCPTSFPKPQATWCATPAPPRGDDPGAAWHRTLRWWRAAPQALLEPWAGGSVATIDDVHALRRELPDLRLCVDTGHVADVGGNIEDFLQLASHVQLRQGCVGNTQLHVHDGAGTVDFRAVFELLERLDYRGRLSIEYFNLPAMGWTLHDPRAWALDLARHIADFRWE